MSSKTRSKSVIIIGAGASGIAAATKLLKNGFEVTVLEAEDRIGGRIHSVEFGESLVDLGAEWVHGEDGNIVYEMVKSLDLVGHSDRKRSTVCTAEGVAIRDGLAEEMNEIRLKIYREAAEVKDNLPLADYFDERYPKEVMARFKNNSEELKIALDAVEMHKRIFQTIHPTQQKVSCRRGMVYLPGDFWLHWKGRGFQTILKILLEPFPNLQVKLNHEVLKIKWMEDKLVKVVCKNGQEYSAEHVISTAGLGVLKKCGKELFEPILPAEKLEVVRSLGFGSVFKAMVEFRERWWDGLIPANFLWKDRTSPMSDLTWTIGQENNPKVLLLYFTGSNIADLEKIPEETFAELVFATLKQIFGKVRNVNKPIKIIRSSWIQNSHFGGVYSFDTVESGRYTNSARVILSEPLAYNGVPKVLFAGEATHPTYYGSAHGAIESGFREANRLIKLYGIKDNS